MTDAHDQKRNETTLPVNRFECSDMRIRRLLRGRPDFFVSAKAPAPIPARHPALRAGLVQASLAPEVRSIVHVATAHVASVPVDLDALVLTHDDGRFVLDVVPDRRIRDVYDEGLVQIALRDLGLKPVFVTAEDLKAEPRRANVARSSIRARASPESKGAALNPHGSSRRARSDRLPTTRKGCGPGPNQACCGN